MRRLLKEVRINMPFRQCKYIYKKISEMNNILRYIKKQEYEIIYGPYTKDPDHPLSKTAFIEDKVSKLYVDGKLVVENPSLTQANVMICDENGEETDWSDLHV